MHFTEKKTATPEQFIAALTDFGKGREKIRGNSADTSASASEPCYGESVPAHGVRLHRQRLGSAAVGTMAGMRKGGDDG